MRAHLTLPAGPSRKRRLTRSTAKCSPGEASHGRSTTSASLSRKWVAGVAIAIAALAACTPSPTPVSYVSFDHSTLNLSAYPGRRVALLLPTDQTWNAAVVWAIVGRLDAAYDYYTSVTGHEPAGGSNYHGLDAIAVVPSTCGAGCGYLGAQGIELQSSYWQILYDGVAQHNQYDQPLFYELGRNFWFLESKLAYLSPDDGGTVTTGFAVLNRFTSMDAAGVTGGPFNGIAFATFRANVHALVDSYEADPSLTWSNTLKVGAGIPGSYLGSTDLFASFVMRLADYFGPGIYTHIWTQAATLPDRTSTQGAVDNFVLAASAAAGHNLTTLFGTTWRFPVSAAAAQQARTRWGAPWIRPAA